MNSGTKENNMKKIKPCPFCGSTNIDFKTKNGTPNCLVCEDCGCTGPETHDRIDNWEFSTIPSELIELWNNGLINNMNKETPNYSQCPYIPEQWVMLKDNIYAAQRAIRIGLEHIDEVIANTEKHYPDRQIVKYLEILKNEKLICEQALEGLSKPLADH